MDRTGRWEVSYLSRGSLNEWFCWNSSAWSQKGKDGVTYLYALHLHSTRKKIILCKTSFMRPYVYSNYSFRTTGRNKTEGQLIEDTVFFPPIHILTFTRNSWSFLSLVALWGDGARVQGKQICWGHLIGWPCLDRVRAGRTHPRLKMGERERNSGATGPPPFLMMLLDDNGWQVCQLDFLKTHSEGPGRSTGPWVSVHA